MNTPTPEAKSQTGRVELAVDLARLEAVLAGLEHELWAPRLPPAKQLPPVPGLPRLRGCTNQGGKPFSFLVGSCRSCALCLPGWRVWQVLARLSARRVGAVIARCARLRTTQDGLRGFEDYDVLHNGEDAGRIFKASAAAPDRPWFWGLAYGYHREHWPISGYEPTREAAMVRKSWMRQ
jgi:hypothetical protein